MSDRYVQLMLHRRRAHQAKELLEEVAAQLGLAFVHPTTSAVVSWTAQGRNDGMTLAELFARLSGGNPVAFQMWWSDREDLFCGFGLDANFVTLYFPLFGVSEGHQSAITQTLWRIATASAFAESLAALVFDVRGNSAEVIWEEQLMSNLDGLRSFPNTLLISTELPAFQKLDTGEYLAIHVPPTFASVLRLDELPRIAS